MSRERGITGPVRIANTDNCLTGSLITIFEQLTDRYSISPNKLKSALVETDDYHLSNLMELLKQHSLINIDHDLLGIEFDKDAALEIIIRVLDARGLCEICVKGTPWITEVLEEVDLTPSDELHSIVLLGYYQPNSRSTWFYIADTYCMKVVFVSWKQLVGVLSTDDDALNVNIFGNTLQEISDITTTLSTKDEVQSKRIQKKILKALPNKKPKNKLKAVIRLNK